MAYDSTIPDPDNFGLEDLLKMKENFSQLEQNGAGIIGYNNSNSGLTAEKVQGAIDLLSELITTNSNIISTITGAASGWADARIVEHNLDVADPPNGYYVRWENGLQVCYTFLTFTYLVSTRLQAEWTFPASFVDANRIFAALMTHVRGDVDMENVRLIYEEDVTRSAVGGRIKIAGSSFTTQSTLHANVLAIGRWK